ncbi:MAG: phage portal protein [Ruminococcus sp.]|nr:phage portal protein [Ruminococcus sp.]
MGKKEVILSSEEIEGYFRKYETSKFLITEIALFTAIDLIARSVAKCEFVTAKEGKECRGAEYYAWNYAPNKHQTKGEFIAEFVANLFFKNEALIIETVDGQRLVADSFSKKEYAIYDDVFSNVKARGYTFNKNFTSSEVIYLKYSNVGVVKILSSLCKSYEKLMNSAEKRYNKAIGHKGVLKIDAMATNDPEFQKKFNELMNERFKEYFNAQDAVLPLYDGYDYSEPTLDASKTTQSEINDIQKLKSEAIDSVANAIHIPPSIIKGEASQLSDAFDVLIANAVDTITRPFGQEITKKVYGFDGFKKGDYCIVDTTTVKHIDVITSATNIDKAIACRVLTPAKAQAYCNMLPSDDESAKSYYLTKNYQTADMALKGEGGEK